MRLRRAIMVARPLALGVADQRIADAAGGRDLDFQKRYAVLQHVLDHDLHRIPTDRISPYLAHLTQRLRLDHQTVTAAAVDRLVPNLTSTGRPEHIVEGFTARIHAAECFPARQHHRSPSTAAGPQPEPGSNRTSQAEGSRS